MLECLEGLESLLKEELSNPGQPISSSLDETLLLLKQKEDQSTLITSLISNQEVIRLILEVCDTKPSLFKVLYPLLYLWVQLNTIHSLALICEFIPSLIWRYLSTAGDDEPVVAESILMNLANILSEKTAFSFRLPSIHMISVYHHPAKMQYTGGLTEASLSKGFNMEPVYSENTSERFSSINASNRLALLTLLLEKYNQNIGDASPASVERYCWLCIWVCGSGMISSMLPVRDMKCWAFSPIRYTLNRGFMTALTSGLQYCLYNGHHVLGKDALDTIAVRAQYEVCAEVMMLTTSLQDEIKISSVSLSSKPFGIPIPQLSGTQNDTRPVRRSIIRNEDVQLARKRFSSNEIREDSENEGGPSPASPIIDVNDESDESDIHIAGFRGGRLQNTSV